MSQLFPPPPSHPSRRPTPATPPRFVAPPSRNIHAERPVASAPQLPTNVPPSPPPPSPPELPHTQSMPGSVDPLADDSSSDDDATIDEPVEEAGLSEGRLRELYDEEEIDRFLHLFSAYVREVRIPQSPNASQVDLSQGAHRAEGGTTGEPWVSPQAPGAESQPQVSAFDAVYDQGLANWAASMLALYLPPPPPPQPSFSVRKARLTANRLFLAVEPTYLPILTDLYNLATWKEPSVSAMYCLLYWFLWYNGLLLSGLCFKLLYALMRRNFLSYPTFAELQQYRRDRRLADSFSRKIILRFMSSPAHSVREMWDTFQDFRAARKKASAAKREAEEAQSSTSTFNSVDFEEPVEAPEIVIEDLDEAEKDHRAEEDYIPILDEPHLATHVMHFANQVADIHERIKNIFLWRRPHISTLYALCFLGLALVAMLPAKYLVRGAGFGAGVLFWHVIPVLAAMPASDKKRIPPPLNHAPTDAEYAMELISQRVARGLPIEPQRKRRKARTPNSAATSSVDQSSLHSAETRTLDDSDEEESLDPVPWTKFGGKVAETKAWVGDAKDVLKDGGWKHLGNWTSINPLRPKVELPYGQSEARIDTHTYPAQRKAPGLITLTDTMLYFTPLASSSPDVTIKLEDVLGVKKSSVTKGLKIRWAETASNGVMETNEERFLWVGGRDELFARLVGWNSKRWMKV